MDFSVHRRFEYAGFKSLLQRSHKGADTVAGGGAFMSVSRFVLGLAAVIFKEKLTKQKIFCAVLALIGCVLSSGVLEEIGSVKWTVFGIFIGVLSAFFMHCTVYSPKSA